MCTSASPFLFSFARSSTAWCQPFRPSRGSISTKAARDSTGFARGCLPLDRSHASARTFLRFFRIFFPRAPAELRFGDAFQLSQPQLWATQLPAPAPQPIRLRAAPGRGALPAAALRADPGLSVSGPRVVARLFGPRKKEKKTRTRIQRETGELVFVGGLGIRVFFFCWGGGWRFRFV